MDGEEKTLISEARDTSYELRSVLQLRSTVVLMNTNGSRVYSTKGWIYVKRRRGIVEYVYF